MTRKIGYEPKTFEIDREERPGQTFEVGVSPQSSNQYRARDVSPRTQGGGDPGSMDRPKTLAERVATTTVRAGTAAGRWVLYGSGKPGQKKKKQMRGFTSGPVSASAPTPRKRKKAKAKTSTTRKKRRSGGSGGSGGGGFTSGNSGGGFVW